MKVSDLELEGLKLVELDVYSDARGFFVERFNAEKFKQFGLPHKFVQDNHSFSLPRVLRGLHHQFDPPQLKVIGVSRGKIWDVVVDVRKNSKTFLNTYGVELSAANGRLLVVPGGFAHGFCVLGDEPADVLYKVDALYNPKNEGGILWDDKDLNVQWPVNNPIISDRDNKLLSSKDFAEKL